MVGRRLTRCAAWALLVVSMLMGLAILAGYFRPVSMSIGRASIGVDRQSAELALGSGPLVKTKGVWRIRPSPGAIMLAPQSVWRPTVSEASMTMSATGTAPITSTIKVLYVPLIPWVMLFGAGAGVLWWRLPRVYPRGHCASCGYDLSGSPGGKCPECGSMAFRMLARLLGLARA